MRFTQGFNSWGNRKIELGKEYVLMEKNGRRERVRAFLKKEIVLVAAWILAVFSAFFVPPDPAYINYIDFKSLGILWSLMVIVAGLQKNGLFDMVGSSLLSRTEYLWQLVLLLVLLPFFFGMLITNDVALITFVPFAIYILKRSKKEGLLVPVVVFQTLAANLGSMMTPIGNPQNLYLYGISGMEVTEFLLLMFPYTLLSFLLLLVGILFLPGKKERLTKEKNSGKKTVPDGRKNLFYGILFLFAVMTVAFPKLLPYQLLLLLVFVVFFICDRSVLFHVDYFLLLTFTGFFIFTGNLGSMEFVKDFMTSVVEGHEVPAAAAFSQVISNVPAALLLSGFTKETGKLVIGVNLGGLGTLIASMASLISFKLLTDEYPGKKGQYFLTFTWVSIVFLGILLLMHFVVM